MENKNNLNRYGLIDKESNKILAVYPEQLTGNYEQITKTVMDWYYMQNCSAEEQFRTAYVDAVSDEDIKRQRINLL